ncbi:MAG: hypothetical protein KBD03_02850 [Gammaproteobacteria bacterium]|nr:hypothetical protein [Gammaproteobacteria bacterium]
MANVNPLGSETKVAREQPPSKIQAAIRIQHAFRMYKAKKTRKDLQFQKLEKECEKTLNACLQTIALCQSRLECWLARQSEFTAETPLNVLLDVFAESLPVQDRSKMRVKVKNKKHAESKKHVVLDPLARMITFRIYSLKYIMEQLPGDIESAYVQIRYWMARENEIHHDSVLSERHFVHEMEENLRPFISCALKKMFIGQGAYITLRAPLASANDFALQIVFKADEMQKDLCLLSRANLDEFQQKQFEKLIPHKFTASSPLKEFFLGIMKAEKALVSVDDDNLQKKFLVLFSPLCARMSGDLYCPQFVASVKEICSAYRETQCLTRAFDAKLSLYSQLLSQYEAYTIFKNARQEFMGSLSAEIAKYQLEKTKCFLSNELSPEQLKVVAKMDRKIEALLLQHEGLDHVFSDFERQIINLFNSALLVTDANYGIIEYVLSCSKKLLELNKKSKVNPNELALSQDLLEFLGNPEDADFFLASRKLSWELGRRNLYLTLCKIEKEPKNYTDEQPVPKQPKRAVSKPEPMTIELWRAQMAKLALAMQCENKAERKFSEDESEHKYSAEQLRAAFGHLSEADVEKRKASIAALKITPTIKGLFEALYHPTKDNTFGHRELMHLITSLQSAGLSISYEMRGSHYKVIFHNAVFAESVEPGRETGQAFRPHGSQARSMANNRGFTSEILENLRAFFNRCGFEIVVLAPANKVEKSFKKN